MPIAAKTRWLIAGAVLAVATVAVIAIPFYSGDQLDRIDARPVPHTAAPEHAHAHGPAATPAVAKPSADAPIAWTLPPGWSVVTTQPMRLASFAIADGGTCGLFLFAGGGDRLSNVNRWRGQAGLEPLDAAGLDQVLTAGTCGFGPFQWLPVRGSKASFLAAIVPTPTGQCFVKVEAPDARIDALKESFLAFTASLRPSP